MGKSNRNVAKNLEMYIIYAVSAIEPYRRAPTSTRLCGGPEAVAGHRVSFDNCLRRLRALLTFAGPLYPCCRPIRDIGDILDNGLHMSAQVSSYLVIAGPLLALPIGARLDVFSPEM